jgi:hypothetical protein
VCADTISEPTFLITELRYTLGQLTAQLGDISNRQEAAGTADRPSVYQVLETMLASERTYQGQYSRMTGVPIPEDAAAAQEAGSPAAVFERMRIATITMLEQVEGEWPDTLRELVRQQVAEDRQHTTEIANDRKVIFENDQRPDLNQPLI